VSGVVAPQHAYHHCAASLRASSAIDCN
jgi:hypothetical protein